MGESPLQPGRPVWPRGRLRGRLRVRSALAIRPDFAEAHNNLGRVLAEGPRPAGGGRRAVAAGIGHPARLHRRDERSGLGVGHLPTASLRNGEEALKLARGAEQLTGGRQVEVLDALAAAYAEVGRFAEAVATARQVLELAGRKNRPDVVKDLRSRLALYRARQPFHQSPPPPQTVPPNNPVLEGTRKMKNALAEKMLYFPRPGGYNTRLICVPALFNRPATHQV